MNAGSPSLLSRSLSPLQPGLMREVEFEGGFRGKLLAQGSSDIPPPAHSRNFEVIGEDQKMYFMKVPLVPAAKRAVYETHDASSAGVTSPQSRQKLVVKEAELWRREYKAHLHLSMKQKDPSSKRGFKFTGSHSNIVGLVDFTTPTSSSPGWFLFKMEGPDLHEYFFHNNARGPPTTSECQTIVSQVLLALAYMHAQDFVHCDLRLDNIVTNPDPVKRLKTVKVCDLGRACSTRSPRVHDWSNPDGDAPELLHPVIYGCPGPARDIWSLGCMVHELSFPQGSRLFDGFSCQVKNVPQSQRAEKWKQFYSDPAELESYVHMKLERLPNMVRALVSQMASPQVALRSSAVDLLKDPFVFVPMTARTLKDWTERCYSESSCSDRRFPH